MRFNLDKNALSDRAKGLAAAIIVIVGLAVAITVLWLGYATPWMNTVGFVLIGAGFLSILLMAFLYRYENKGGFGGALYKVAYWNFQVCPPMWENEIDLVVLESFLVFVVFSNMKMRHEKTAFRFSELFKIIYAMWTAHDSVEEER